MERTITVAYPESLANSLKLEDQEFEREIKMLSLLKLYELGKISSGTASKILDIPRVDFLEKLGEYKVSVFGFQDEEDLKQDLKNA